jgi:hypothetical protein
MNYPLIRIEIGVIPGSVTKAKTQASALAAKENMSPNKKRSPLKSPGRRRYSMMPSNGPKSKIPVRKGSSMLPSEIKQLAKEL